jgi:hypothetical protein
MKAAGIVDTVALDDLDEGVTLEVVEVAMIPNAHKTVPRAFLCMDMQMRFVTLDNGAHFLGGPTSEALCRTLTALGFSPVFIGPVNSERPALAD